MLSSAVILMCPHFRDDEVCKQVPVVRLVPQCEQQERVLCEAVPYQAEIQRCVLTNNPVCAPQVSPWHMSYICHVQGHNS